MDIEIRYSLICIVYILFFSDTLIHKFSTNRSTQTHNIENSHSFSRHVIYFLKTDTYPCIYIPHEVNINSQICDNKHIPSIQNLMNSKLYTNITPSITFILTELKCHLLIYQLLRYKINIVNGPSEDTYDYLDVTYILLEKSFNG